MRRTTSLTAAGLLGLALLTPLTSASAAGETCRGEAATIVGQGSTPLTGTEGRDVVVTNGSGRVDTLGGDDLVCITGRDARAGLNYSVDVDTGAGDDVVDGTAANSWGARLVLGAGADRFEGGAATDYVRAGTVVVDGNVVSYPDTDPDVIIGGGGADSLSSGQDGLPNSDVLQGGDGDDGLGFLGTMVDGAVIDGGTGVDRLGLALQPGEQLLDNVASELRHDGALVRRWSSVESFSVGAAQVAGVTLDVRGSAAADDLWLFDAVPLTGDLGAGDDTLSVPALLPAGSSISGGGGRDGFDFGTEDGSVVWDLRSGAVRGDAGAFVAADFEDGFVSAPRARLTGTDGPNDLSVNACDARIDARSGRDSVSVHSDGTFEEFDTCIGSSLLLGGPGRDRISSRAGSQDRMVGGGGNDVFDAVGGNDTVLGGSGDDRAELGNGDDAFHGGPGHDRVDGERGRDLCRAERRTGCER